MKKISFIVPCYNEEAVLGEFYGRTKAVCDSLAGHEHEILFVDDGSVDKTPAILAELAGKDERVGVLKLSRNFGHQAAITAGMDFVSGYYVVIIDADLQDPPELVPEMLGKLEKECDIVHARRRAREGDSLFKKATAWLFYRLIKLWSREDILEDCGDFRMFNRKVLSVARHFREEHRFMRGIFSIIGFKQCVIMYDRSARAGGETKYPLARMIKLAFNAVVSFSVSPLRSIIFFALLSWLISVPYIIKALYDHFVLDTTVPGWTSLIIFTSFFAGLIILSLGIMAAYIGRIFEQGQRRPLYWLDKAVNVQMDRANPDAAEVAISKAIIIDVEK